MQIYAADFETTTDPEHTEVWAWGIANLDCLTPFEFGTNIQSFIEFCYRLRKETKIYFHNLKFDGSFIINYLLQNGWTHTTGDLEEECEFKTIITDKNQWYKITCNFFYTTQKRVRKCFKVYFVDSLKLIPMPIAKMPKTFGLKIEKLEIDYDENREIGGELSQQDFEYLKNDVIILRDSLLQMFENGITKLTLSASAMEDLKETMGKRKFERIFPLLLNDEPLHTNLDLSYEQNLHFSIDKELRHAYRGGWTYLKKGYEGKEFKNVVVYDVNSLYPYVMSKNIFPFGEPIIKSFYSDIKGYPLYIITFECEFWLKEGKLPTIQIKNTQLFNGREYLEHSKSEIVTLTLTSVDFELFKENYETAYFKVQKVYYFRASGQLFTEYIHKWSKVKQEAGKQGNGGLRFIAKQIQNSTYGKFATNPLKTQKVPYLENNVLKFKTLKPEFKPQYYLPVGLFITAYARRHIIKYAQENYEDFIYCDTDSLHLKRKVSTIPCDEEKLGYFKIEKEFDRARYIRAKRYIGEKDGNLLITCAGLPAKCYDQVTFDNFQIGQEYTGKLTLNQTDGGAVLLETTFKLK